MISIRKRNDLYEYRFEAGKVNGKRKQISKSGFKTKRDAYLAGQKAYEEFISGESTKECNMLHSECLDYYNPYIELFTSALYWSGYELCNINFCLFKSFIDSYFQNSKLDRNINWEILYYANNSRLEWLEYNIKRALMLETDSEEEQQLGIKEVKKAMKHIVYYDSIKNELLKNVSN